MRTRFTIWDSIVYAVVIVTALLLLVLLTAIRSDGAVVVITCGNGVSRLPLTENREITLANNNYRLTVAIEAGSVSVTDADCPDRLCFRVGKISHSGESIVCLPAGICIKIEGGDADEADFIAG